MNSNFHLVAELGTYLPQEGASVGLSVLEDYLDGHPEITFTIVTRGPLKLALDRLLMSSRALPRHIIAEAGTAIFHRQKTFSWVEDADYRAWVESQWDAQALERLVESGKPSKVIRSLCGYSSRHAIFEFDQEKDSLQAAEELEYTLARIGLSGVVLQVGSTLEVVPFGVNRGTAVNFLHEHLSDPGPLMVCGSTQLNLNLFHFADYPVRMADSAMDFDTPGIPRERIYRTTHTGPTGMMEVIARMEFDRRYGRKDEAT